MLNHLLRSSAAGIAPDLTHGLELSLEALSALAGSSFVAFSLLFQLRVEGEKASRARLAAGR